MSKELNETEASLRLTENMVFEHDRFLRILKDYIKWGMEEGVLDRRINAYREHYLAGLQKLARGVPYEEVLNPEFGDGLFCHVDMPPLRTLPPAIWELMAKAMGTWCSTMIQWEYGKGPDKDLLEFLGDAVEEAATSAVETLELVED